MLSMNTNANKLAASSGNMNLKSSDTLSVVHAYRVPMALAIIKIDPMAAKMAKSFLSRDIRLNLRTATRSYYPPGGGPPGVASSR